MKIAINDTTEYTKNKKLKVYINLFFNKKIDNFIDSEVYEDFIGTFPTINELINFNEQRSITDPIPVEDYKKYTGEENTTTNTKEIINRHLKHNSNEWILMEEFKISLGYYDHKHWLNCNLNRPLEHFISAEEFRTHFMTKLTYAKLFNLNVCKPLKSPIKDVYLKPKYHPAWNFCMGRDPDHPISAAEIKQYKETNAWNQKISMTSNPDKNLTQLKPRPAPDYNR